jgi:hypothetical protein
MSVITYCSDSETKTETAFIVNISEKYKNIRKGIDWTNVIKALEETNSVYEKFESYSQVEGCFTNQRFFVFGAKFTNTKTQDLIAWINS